ncbi:dbo [Symbiodinium natans]|uniref:Dbo protein n=1 Tax=Symbiodinium natans TaxID=878477 RepID=A0A812HNM7_9DINO|nr:dbo [Symbiodinium natans]
MALPFSLEAKLEEFVNELVSESPLRPGAAKDKFHEMIRMEDMESTPSITTEVISHEGLTPTCSSSATSISDYERYELPMKVSITAPCPKEIPAPSWSTPVHVQAGHKSFPVRTDATRELSSRLPPPWVASVSFPCLSTTPGPEVGAAPFSPFPAPMPVPPFGAPPGLERPMPPRQPMEPMAAMAASQLPPRRPGARARGAGGAGGKFLCRFVFTGFDVTNHADFELVPRLIGRKGCNLRPISEACRGKIRVIGGDGSQRAGYFGMDSPVTLELQCHSRADLDEGFQQLSALLEELQCHFYRYCCKRGISPAPRLYHTLP